MKNLIVSKLYILLHAWDVNLEQDGLSLLCSPPNDSISLFRYGNGVYQVTHLRIDDEQETISLHNDGDVVYDVEFKAAGTITDNLVVIPNPFKPPTNTTTDIENYNE